MDVLGVKIIVLILIGLIKFGSGMLPMYLLPRIRRMGINRRTLDKAMAGVLCVGGGVLLATVFVHMIPEVRETYETAIKHLNEESGHGHDHDDHDHDEHDHHGYPMAELLTCAGFFVIYLIEAVVHRLFLTVHDHKHGGHGHSHAVPAHMLDDQNEDPEKV